MNDLFKDFFWDFSRIFPATALLAGNSCLLVNIVCFASHGCKVVIQSGHRLNVCFVVVSSLFVYLILLSKADFIYLLQPSVIQCNAVIFQLFILLLLLLLQSCNLRHLSFGCCFLLICLFSCCRHSSNRFSWYVMILKQLFV